MPFVRDIPRPFQSMQSTDSDTLGHTLMQAMAAITATSTPESKGPRHRISGIDNPVADRFAVCSRGAMMSVGMSRTKGIVPIGGVSFVRGTRKTEPSMGKTENPKGITSATEIAKSIRDFDRLTPREAKRLVQPDQCTCDHHESESSWPAAVEDKGNHDRPGRAGWCLGHALIETCLGCGAAVAFCHLTGCGDCRPVSNAAGIIIRQIYDAQI